MSLTWIMQSGLFSESRFRKLYEVVAEHNDIIDVDNCLQGRPDPELETRHIGDVMVYGSIGLLRWAVEENLGPHVYPNMFDHQDWVKHWGEECLNYGATIMKLGDIQPDAPYIKRFIRPVADWKAFEGQIISMDKIDLWRSQILKQWKHATEETLCLVAELKQIENETRCFVVDGKVVGGSQYRSHNQTLVGEAVPGHVEYVEDLISVWHPEKCFVVDVASTLEGFRMVEVNSINCSGIYDVDPTALVGAINEQKE